MNGLGRLAKGEMIEEPSIPAGGMEAAQFKTEEIMDIDAMPAKTERIPEAVSGSGKAKKKKGKK